MKLRSKRFEPIPLMTLAMSLAMLGGCDNAQSPAPLPSGDATGASSDTEQASGPLIDVPGSPSPIDDGMASNGAEEAQPLAEPVISEPYRGRWAVTPADCRAEPGLGRIVVGASEILFGKASGEPLSVLQAGERSIIVNMLIVHNRQRIERVDRLTIDPDGITLLYRSGGEARTYRRCPV